jgi:bifunctional enzyme CysN/CysC
VNSGKKPIAKALEGRLFSEGKIVYFLGIGNLLYGLDADIKNVNNNRVEHIRRLSEVANILLDTGAILIVTAIELTQDDLEVVKTIIDPERIEVVWLGEEVSTSISCDLIIHDPRNLEESVGMIKNMLRERGSIFKV